MEALQREYEKLLNAQRFDPRELDYSVLERHISQLTLLSQVSNSGITVFDMYTRRHAFASYNFAELFQYDLESIATEDSDYFTGRIHPDDRKELHRNGIACLRYLMDHKELAPDVKLIDEYRVDVGGRYVRVIEQFQVLEFDRSGNIWLSLSILDVSPNQGTEGGTQPAAQLSDGRSISAPDTRGILPFQPRTGNTALDQPGKIIERNCGPTEYQCTHGQYAPTAYPRKTECG